MTRSRPITFLAATAAVPLVALAVSACGGAGAATASPPPAALKTTATTAFTKTETVRVASSRLGRILVDSQGRTLYLFKADSGGKSACYGTCALAWPPLRTGGAPVAGSGTHRALLGTIARSDGARQVTYDGHPLYLFVKDHRAGDVNGQGLTAFGAAWFAVSSAGNQIASRRSGHGRGSSSSSPPPTTPAPPPTTTPAPPPTTTPAPPVTTPAPPPNGGIPQNNGGDGDGDNNGAPSDGDGDV